MKPEINPKQQPCKTCRHFVMLERTGIDGWGECTALEDTVRNFWTGCIRWKPKVEHGDEERNVV